jgi:NAD(P)-dependent dehydrogenase (short-subunit alcohol dehydrogenase family)
MSLSLAGRVAIVTGAGAGLGRTHALALARAGARVVVNDLGGARDGTGGATDPAEAVAAEIAAMGGDAIVNAASVTNAAAMAAMADEAVSRWGQVDILVNNAGILRDKSFAKMSLADFAAVIDVHLMGSVNCTKAVWDHMRERNYGRIVFTTSSSGLYGNFGQANYAAAKMALVGLMQTLGIEGAKHGIRVNCLAPSGATRMLEGLLPEPALALLAPERVSAAMLALVHDEAPNRMIMCAGAGSVEQAYVTLTEGIHVGSDADADEAVLRRLGDIGARTAEVVPAQGFDQPRHELAKAGYDLAAA